MKRRELVNEGVFMTQIPAQKEGRGPKRGYVLHIKSCFKIETAFFLSTKKSAIFESPSITLSQILSKGVLLLQKGKKMKYFTGR